MYRKLLNNILLSDKPSVYIYELIENGQIENIIPELMKLRGFEQKTPYHDKDVLEHTMAVLDNIAPRLNLRMAALLHDIGKPDCFTTDEKGIGHFYGHHILSSKLSIKILERLGYEKEFIDNVALLIKYHYIKDIADVIKEKGIKRFINSVGVKNLDDMFELIKADTAGKANANYEILEKLKTMCCEYIMNKQ